MKHLLFSVISLFTVLVPQFDLTAQELDHSTVYIKRFEDFQDSPCNIGLQFPQQDQFILSGDKVIEYKIYSNDLIMLTAEVDCPAQMAYFYFPASFDVAQLQLDLTQHGTFYVLMDNKKSGFLREVSKDEFLDKRNKKKKKGDEPEVSDGDVIKADIKLEESQSNPMTDDEDGFGRKGNGTGFLLSKDGFIVTNYHVIDKAKKISIRGLNGNMDLVIPGKVVLSDAQNDLAIIKPELDITISQDIPFDIRPNSVETGENLFVLGYPFADNMGYEVKLTNGLVSSKSGYEGSISSFQLSAPVSPGNSGGPVFDSNGSLIGIVFAKHTMANNAGYAIKTNYLNILWDMLDNAPALPNNNTLKGLPLNEQIKLLNDLVLVIEVEK